MQNTHGGKLIIAAVLFAFAATTDLRTAAAGTADGKKVTKTTVVQKPSPKVTTVKKRVVVRRPVTTRVVVRVPLVVLGPRVVYRSYGPGWCRGLHRGYHWAPKIGWHSRRHVGLFRC